MKKNITRYVRDNILSLEPYSTARDDFNGVAEVYVDANENPFPNGYNRYPDPSQKLLKSKISAIKGVAPENIFIGNGSDEAIDLCYRIFCVPGKSNAIMIAPSYGMYSVSASINDVEVRKVALEEDFSLSAESMLARADANSRLMFICSPNNPSGNAFSLDDIVTLVENFDGMVVVDEAYIDFSTKGSMLQYIDKYDNLIILQTLSKAYGMAGLRLGLAFSNTRVMGWFANVKYPYNIDSAAMNEAYALLDRDIREEVASIIEQRGLLEKALVGLPDVFKVWPSDANFLLVQFSDAKAMYRHLLDGGVIVRDRSSVKGCEGCLRLTVGTPSENDTMLSLIRNYR